MLTVITSDAAGNEVTTTKTFNLDTLAPVLGAAQISATINENISEAATIHTAQASDATAVNYSLKPNTGDASAFTINNNTGAVKFIKSPNYEAKLSYSFTIVATDQLGNISEQLVRLAVNNLDESAPTITSSGNAISAEGQAILYRAAADDSLDASAGINWRLEGPDAPLLNISSAGDVTLKNGTNINRETKGSYSFTVVASDGATGDVKKAIVVAIKDINDNAPIFSSPDNTTINENAPAGSQIYRAAATDADALEANNKITYSLKSGVGDEAALTIDSTTGIVKLNGSPDFESKSQYQFTVIATDNGLPTQKTEKSVVVYVNDANDAPTSKGDAGTQTVVNGKAFSFNLANSFADVDAGTNGTLRFAISNGTLPAGLSLDPATGLITGSATTDGLVAFTVTATDTNGATNSLSVAQNFAFNVVSAPAVLSFTAVDSTGITTAGRAGEGWSSPSWYPKPSP